MKIVLLRFCYRFWYIVNHLAKKTGSLKKLADPSVRHKNGETHTECPSISA